MAKALSIAGSDPSSGAGIQADLKTFSALGVYGTSVITVVTVQNTRQIRKVSEVKPDIIKAQIKAVLSDISVDAIKVGMVYSKSIVTCVSSALRNVKVPIILDPIFKASTGAILLKNGAFSSFIKRLVPLASVITPNVMEAERLAGIRIKSIGDEKLAAKNIANLGAKNVIIKGGHMQGRYSIDLLHHDGIFREFRSVRANALDMHGAGCTFSAALTAEIAKGKNVVDATRAANEFVNLAIKKVQRVGKGLRIVNPDYYMKNSDMQKVINAVAKAVTKLEDTDGLGILIPESQSNLVFALPGAESLNDVAGVKGRIVRIDNDVKTASNVDFGASKHVASAILAIMQNDRSIRSAMNIRYDEKIVSICRDLGLKVSSYDRRTEPQEIKTKDGMSVKWGIEQATAKINAVPDVVYHLGDWGKEPMILVFGKNPTEVLKRVFAILGKYSKM